MKRKELDALKTKIKQKTEESSDLHALVEAISKLPYGQFKKVATDEVLEILTKYGYVEAS